MMKISKEVEDAVQEAVKKLMSKGNTELEAYKMICLNISQKYSDSFKQNEEVK